MTEATAPNCRGVRDNGAPPPLPEKGIDTATRPSLAGGGKQWWQSLVVAGGLLAIIAVTRPLAQWRLPLPQCLLRKFTGLPCPSCGCTRSLRAWAELDFAQAFSLNPLFFLLCAGVLLWPVVTVFERISGRAWLSQACASVPARRRWQIVVGLIALNWLYLWLRLPK